LHIVPRGVHRVRYGGLFHGKGRTARLDRCRKLLIEHNERNDIQYDTPSAASLALASPATESPATEPEQAERNLPKCARCKTPEMKSLGFQDARTTRAMIAITQRIMALYAVSWTTLEDWSDYFRKNVRVKKEVRGIRQTWFEFDPFVQEIVLCRLADSLTSTVIDPRFESLPSHNLPIPDW
jgi:hypothetical protein